MTRKLLSITLILTVIASVGGVTLPCTLHCLQKGSMNHAHMQKGMNSDSCHHQEKADEECDNSCMLQVETSDSEDQPSDGAADPPSERRMNLMAVNYLYTLDPPPPDSAFFRSSVSSNGSLWIMDPATPPPKLIFAV